MRVVRSRGARPGGHWRLHRCRQIPGARYPFVTELRERCATLAEMPLAYPRREDFGKGVRLMVHRRYLVRYRVVRRPVRIERVLHGARHVIALVQSSDDS